MTTSPNSWITSIFTTLSMSKFVSNSESMLNANMHVP